jgi:hypothetical protein
MCRILEDVVDINAGLKVAGQSDPGSREIRRGLC